MRRAIRLFRTQYYGVIGQWKPRPHEVITVDEWDIEKGRATLILAVTKMLETRELGIIESFRVPRVIAKHNLTIDRTGDILESRSIPMDSTWTTQQRPLSETTLTIKSRKEPRKEQASGGVNVIIEFEVENRGRAGKACPYIEFQVATEWLEGKYSSKKWNTKPKPIEIPALCVKPLIYTLFFHFPHLPLIEPPYEVKIELHPCPDTRSRS